MNQLVKRFGTGLILGLLVTGLAACGHKEGPAEKAGKAVDNAVDTAGQKIQQAGEDLQNVAKGDNK